MAARTVFEAIKTVGHDEDFEPWLMIGEDDFQPTEHPAGSREKVEVIKQRVKLGQPLFHPLDNPEIVLTKRESEPNQTSIRIVAMPMPQRQRYLET